MSCSHLGDVVELKGQMTSRLLYPSPVCLLTVAPPDQRANAMVITWLTPIDNKGGFIMSMNKKRHTASLVQACSHFVLNVPVAGMEDTILKIGTSTGAQLDKFKEYGIQTCLPGWRPFKPSNDSNDSNAASLQSKHQDLCDCEHDISVQMRQRCVLQSAEEDSATSSAHSAAASVAVTSQAPTASEPTDLRATETATTQMTLVGAVPLATLAATASAAISSHMRKLEEKLRKSTKNTKNTQSDSERFDQGVLAITDCVAHLVCSIRACDDVDGHYIFRCFIDHAWVRSQYWTGKCFVAMPPAPPLLVFLGTKMFAQVLPCGSSQPGDPFPDVVHDDTKQPACSPRVGGAAVVHPGGEH